MTDSSNHQVNLRNAVLNLLMETEAGEKSHIVLKRYLDSHLSLEKNERAFITRLFQGTLERRIELDFIIDLFSKTKTNKIKPVILQILRLSVYQIKYMDAVPAFAACNEAVKLTNKRKLGNLKGFVNGVLRNIERNMEQIDYPKDETEYLSVVYSVPEWIIKMWQEEYGTGKTKEILESLYRDKKLTLRCNTSQMPEDKSIAMLKGEGIAVEQSLLNPKVLYISEYDNLEKSETFREGFVTVQDLSSIFACVAANPKNGDYIIDVCAAPGGKSICLADMMNGSGIVDARDLSEKKTNLIRENISRMKFDNIDVKVWDATVPDTDSYEKADIVIADLPCSGLGVIGHKNDIKYNISEKQIGELKELQRKIISVVGKYVKPGGKLIYSTCTVNKKENDENAAWILENLPFEKMDLSEVLPKQLNVKDNTLQIFPGESGMDGFFIAGFVKK